MKDIHLLAGRVLLAFIFVMAGYNKIAGYEGTQGYMDSVGVPGMLLPLVIILELGAGLALMIGWQTRWSAWALAAFTLVAAFLFHADFSNQMQGILFMKNVAISGGLLILAATGAGRFSLEGRKA